MVTYAQNSPKMVNPRDIAGERRRRRRSLRSGCLLVNQRGCRSITSILPKTSICCYLLTVESSSNMQKNGQIRTNLTQNGEPQRYSWGTQKKTKTIEVWLCIKKSKWLSGLLPQSVCCYLLIEERSSNIHNVSHIRIYLDNCTCCHTEVEIVDQTCYLFRSLYADVGQTSPTTSTASLA